MTERPLAIGCMRLSTEPGRDEERGLAVLAEALSAGVRLFGHGARLEARSHALAARRKGPADRTFAERLGMDYKDAETFFAA